MDKVSFYQYALEHNLAIPQTFFLHNRQDAEHAATALSYPALLKPPMKTNLWEDNTKEKVYKIDSAEELLELYDRCSEWVDILLVQVWVVGTDADLFSCNCYFDAQYQPLVTFIARKLRQWPPQTGTSCLGEEIRNDSVLEESLKLFRSVNYHGLGYVEMKRDERTGDHFIIEPNIGRPTGRSAIAEAGGVELLYTAYCDMVGLPLPDNRTQQYRGAKWISLRRDFQSAFFYWRRGDLSLRDWIHSWSGKKAYAIFSWSDPAPFIFDFLKLFDVLKDKLLQR
jgi:predicted ATP-grasp superfamily ATP-dependent carboligase